MGSGADAVEETSDWPWSGKGEKVGVLKVRLFRPFSVEHFMAAIPASVRKIAVLDRTKEPGSMGEPLYEDVRTAIGEAMGPAPGPSRPGLPSSAAATASARPSSPPRWPRPSSTSSPKDSPKGEFVVGPTDDVTMLSLAYDPEFHIETAGEVECLFYGLGSDGTVGANENSIKIIGDDTPTAPRAISSTTPRRPARTRSPTSASGPRLKKPYLIGKANFIACHKFAFLEKIDMLQNAKQGGVFLLNSPYPADKVWAEVPVEVQKTIIAKKLKFYVIDGMAIAEKAGMGSRVNTIMQTAFFKISAFSPRPRP